MLSNFDSAAGVPILRNGRPDHGSLGVAPRSRLPIELLKRFGSVRVTPKGNSTSPYRIFGDGRLLVRKVADGTSAIRPDTSGLDPFGGEPSRECQVLVVARRLHRGIP